MRRSGVRIPLAPPPEGPLTQVSGPFALPEGAEQKAGDPVSARMSARMRTTSTSVPDGVRPALARPAHLVRMDTNTRIPLDRVHLWTIDELAEKLRVSKATIHAWRKRGTAPRAYRIGRHLMFLPEVDLDGRVVDPPVERGCGLLLARGEAVGVTGPQAHPHRLQRDGCGPVRAVLHQEAAHELRVRLRSTRSSICSSVRSLPAPIVSRSSRASSAASRRLELPARPPRWCSAVRSTGAPTPRPNGL